MLTKITNMENTNEEVLLHINSEQFMCTYKFVLLHKLNNYLKAKQRKKFLLQPRSI